jgi:hypothetical protein
MHIDVVPLLSHKKDAMTPALEPSAVFENPPRHVEPPPLATFEDPPRHVETSPEAEFATPL